ncbi:uncharacterized protein LOC126895300 isoform X6 [Daktulosphaira vitifoliae]|uniref:uncharacterized protein LOC126895300 isoform X6 n=1 Tax=Daktulosphaira vitifoliae TaxID=58002 RepID=UPI0021AA325D|nr:uncharacterized protein LOC126895300 isoform X6 [Daktulosphaira vitifoliae]
MIATRGDYPKYSIKVQRSNKIIPEHTPKNQESKKHLLELAPMNNGKIQPGYNNVDDLCGNSRPATEYPNENTLEPTYSSDHVTGHTTDYASSFNTNEGRNISYSTSDYRTSSYSTSSFDNYDGMI